MSYYCTAAMIVAFLMPLAVKAFASGNSAEHVLRANPLRPGLDSGGMSVLRETIL